MKKRLEIATGFVLGIIAILVVIAFTGQSESYQQDFNKTIEVTGNGVVKAVPDEAHIVIAVETEAKSASEASQLNAEKMNNVYQELKKVVDENSIKTRSYSLQPVYEWIEEVTVVKKQRREIVGYKATNMIEVICKPEKSGDVIDTAIDSGANRINSITFTLSEEQREVVYSEALKKAVRDAKTKAEVIVSEMGIESYHPVRVIVGGVYYPVPMPAYYIEGDVVQKTPIAPSDVEIKAEVRIVYAFE